MRRQASSILFHQSPPLGTELEKLKEGKAGRTKWGQKEDGPFMPKREVGEESGAKLGPSQSYYWECQAK